MTRRLAVAIAMIAGAASAGCPKDEKPSAGAAASASAAPAASADAGAADAASAKDAARTFTGAYESKPGTLFIPSESDWKSTKYKDDGGALVGKGDVSITIEPDGRVHGATTGGPVGDAVIEGRADGAKLTATVRRKNASDEGLTGTLSGTLEGGALTGAMQLSEANASVVRVAEIHATAAK